MRVTNQLKVPMGDWRIEANCKGADPELFFPVDTTKQGVQKLAEVAIKICDECSVRQECFDFAFRTRQKDGVWGGVLFNYYRKRRNIKD